MRSVILLVLAALPALAAYSNGYTYRRTVTVQSAQVPSTQTDFPMLISGTYDGTAGVADLRTVANGGKVEGVCNQTTIIISVGCDIIFTSDAAGSSVLNFEFETYSASSGVINLWVKVPSISNGTVIYMFYGNVSISTFQGNVNGTWDTNFKAVYHLPNGTSLTANDSTSNGNTGTLTNTSGSGVPTATAGKIDGGASMTRANNQLITAADSASLSLTGSFTLSAWFNTTSAAAQQGIIEKYTTPGVSGYILRLTAAGKLLGDTLGASDNPVTGATTVSTSVWTHAAVIYNGTTLRVYLNGAQDGTLTTSVNPTDGAGTLKIGARGDDGLTTFGGVLDEIHISSVARSTAWLTAEYNNQSSPSSFYAIGGETLAGGSAVMIMQ